jgi:hypothetical protein
MMTKKDKSILNTFLKKNIFKQNFALSILEQCKFTKFHYIKKKDVLINKFLYMFKSKDTLKSFKLSLNITELDLSKFFLIKHEKSIFFDVFLFKKNNIKIFFCLFTKNLIINYNYYLNNLKI